MRSASLKLRFMSVSLLFCVAPVIALAQDMPAGAWAGTWVANTAYGLPEKPRPSPPAKWLSTRSNEF